MTPVLTVATLGRPLALGRTSLSPSLTSGSLPDKMVHAIAKP